MKQKEHAYSLYVNWTGNQGVGTKSYDSYSRDHTIQVMNKPLLQASSDPMFRGDASKYNPEELFVASLSTCHMLWYLHLCAMNGIVVEAYEDKAVGKLVLNQDGSGKFSEIVLHPTITITDLQKKELAEKLHIQAHQKCFIANSCNFEIAFQPVIQLSKS